MGSKEFKHGQYNNKHVYCNKTVLEVYLEQKKHIKIYREKTNHTYVYSFYLT